MVKELAHEVELGREGHVLLQREKQVCLRDTLLARPWRGGERGKGEKGERGRRREGEKGIRDREREREREGCSLG